MIPQVYDFGLCAKDLMIDREIKGMKTKDRSASHHTSHITEQGPKCVILSGSAGPKLSIPDLGSWMQI